MIKVKDLYFGYPKSDRDALVSVDLEVQHGAFHLVAGPSAGGKSTLLRTFNGLVPHHSGGVISGMLDVAGRDPIRKRPRQMASTVGFVGQDPEDHAVAGKVEDDIAFVLENLRVDRTTIRKRVEEALDALGLAGLRDRRIETLSGGERQRVAIAGALVAMPQYIVLDEPTSSLDPQSSEDLLSVLLRLRDEIGIGVVMAEHRLDRVLSYASNITLIEEGSAETGTPNEMFGKLKGLPLVRLSNFLDWHPPALTLSEARRQAANVAIGAPHKPPVRPLGEKVASARDLRVQYGGTTVLGPLDMLVSEGEVLVVMGRNGSGKTTLLRALAGLIRTKSVTRPPSIALVPQNPHKILFRENGRREIRASLMGRGLAHSASDVEDEADRLGVSDFLDRHPRELSGGQRTRLAIAAAIAGDPKLILLDEPTRGMDAESKLLLGDRMDAWKVQGKAVVVATHDVELAARVASRVMILADGDVVALGSPQETLASSLTFSTQISKVFGRPDLLTVDDAIAAMLSS